MWHTFITQQTIGHTVESNSRRLLFHSQLRSLVFQIFPLHTHRELECSLSPSAPVLVQLDQLQPQDPGWASAAAAASLASASSLGQPSAGGPAGAVPETASYKPWSGLWVVEVGSGWRELDHRDLRSQRGHRSQCQIQGWGHWIREWARGWARGRSYLEVRGG